MYIYMKPGPPIHSVYPCRMKSPSPRCTAWRPERPAPGGRRPAIAPCHRRFRLWRFFRRLRVDNGILEPIGQIGRLAAFARRWFRLALAPGGAGRTFDADMEVIVVAVHRPHLMEPAAVALGFAAQRFLDRGIDEDALHARFLRRRADHREMARRPGARIDIEPIGATIMTADVSSRSSRDNRRSGIGVSQISASSPT